MLAIGKEKYHEKNTIIFYHRPELGLLLSACGSNTGRLPRQPRPLRRIR